MRITLLGMNKTLNSPINQAKPMTPDVMLDMVAYLDLAKQVDLVFWAIVVIGFFTFFRKSNLIPDMQDSFDARRQLSRGAVRFEDDIAVLTVTWTKTVQYR